MTDRRINTEWVDDVCIISDPISGDCSKVPFGSEHIIVTDDLHAPPIPVLYGLTSTLSLTPLSDLVDFPVLVDVSISNLRCHPARAIRFYDINGNYCPKDVISFDSLTGHLICWVKTTVYAEAGDNVLTIKVGGPLEPPAYVYDQERGVYVEAVHLSYNFRDVWSNGYWMVLHFTDIPVRGGCGHLDYTIPDINRSPFGDYFTPTSTTAVDSNATTGAIHSSCCTCNNAGIYSIINNSSVLAQGVNFWFKFTATATQLSLQPINLIHGLIGGYNEFDDATSWGIALYDHQVSEAAQTLYGKW